MYPALAAIGASSTVEIKVLLAGLAARHVGRAEEIRRPEEEGPRPCAARGRPNDAFGDLGVRWVLRRRLGLDHVSARRI